MSVNAALENYNITQAELDQILTGLNSISRQLNLTLELIVQVSVIEVSPSDGKWKKFCIDAIAKSVIEVLEGSSKLPKQDGTPFDFFGHGNGEFGMALALVREDIRYPESTKNKIGV
ncbi:hypothetical protein JCM33374_g2581 [Metschnikowia sp. JCM 33374]|nr:hypothetical protein JCM33374_g2581 [Metschnikowia sp. JCM 33374]